MKARRSARALSGSAVILAVVLIGVAGCSPGAREPIDLHIGVIAMLSGSDTDRENGTHMTRGARLAAALTNRETAARGVPRVRVRLEEVDDRNSPDGAVDAVRQLINVDRVSAIVGPQFSRNAIPAARVSESAQTVMICPMSTNPETTLGKRFVFRVAFLDTFQGRILARFARGDLRASTAAVLYDVSNQYNRVLATVFREVFEDLGGTILAEETYTSDAASDFRPMLARVGAKAPEVLFLPNLSDDVMRQARQAREMGLTSVLLGGDGWDARRMALDSRFDGCFCAVGWDPDLPGEPPRAFRAAYSAAYSEDPQAVAATTFDAVRLLVAAARHAGRADADSLRSGLLGMGPFAGATGTISYRNGGDPLKSVALVRIGAGAAPVFKVFAPETE